MLTSPPDFGWGEFKSLLQKLKVEYNFGADKDGDFIIIRRGAINDVSSS